VIASRPLSDGDSLPCATADLLDEANGLAAAMVRVATAGPASAAHEFVAGVSVVLATVGAVGIEEVA